MSRWDRGAFTLKITDCDFDWETTFVDGSFIQVAGYPAERWRRYSRILSTEQRSSGDIESVYVLVYISMHKENTTNTSCPNKEQNYHFLSHMHTQRTLPVPHIHKENKTITSCPTCTHGEQNYHFLPHMHTRRTFPVSRAHKEKSTLPISD